MKKFIIYLTLVFFLFKLDCAQASKLYASGEFGWASTVSQQELTNGTDGFVPTGYFGIRFEKVALEGGLRIYSLEDIDGDPGQEQTTIKITDKAMLFGLRIFPAPFTELKFGVGIHSVEAKYTSSTRGALVSKIDGTKGGFYMGMGFNYPFTSWMEGYTTMTLDWAGVDYSLFSAELGLRFYFLEL